MYEKLRAKWKQIKKDYSEFSVLYNIEHEQKLNDEMKRIMEARIRGSVYPLFNPKNK